MLRRRKEKIGPRFACFALFFLLWSGGIAAAAGAEGSDQEQALRGRVEGFYSLMQVARWSQAEAYVAQDSLENYRDQSKKPFLDFEISSIQLDPGGESATVTVQMTFFTMYSPQPLTLPRSTRWRLVDGDWYVEVPKPDPAAMSKVFSSKGKGSSPRPPEELKFEGHRYGLGVLQPGEVKVARFPFTNVTDHVVTISEVILGCECLKLKTEKMSYEPGESGELVIEFDSTGIEYQYGQSVMLKTAPGDRTTYLTIVAHVVPPHLAAPKPEEEEKEPPA